MIREPSTKSNRRDAVLEPEVRKNASETTAPSDTRLDKGRYFVSRKIRNATCNLRYVATLARSSILGLTSHRELASSLRKGLHLLENSVLGDIVGLVCLVLIFGGLFVLGGVFQ